MAERTGREPQLSDEGSPQGLYRRAREHFVSGERDLAEEFAHRVLALQPQHEGSLHMLAAIQEAKQQETAMREEELRRQWADSVSRQREAEEAFLRGLQALASHQRAEAAQAFREAVRLDPEHGAAQEYVDLFDQQEARQHEQQALAQAAAAARPTPNSTSPTISPHTLKELITLMLSLAISAGVTYLIVKLFSTIIPSLENGLPLSLFLCGWVFFPLFVLTLGTLNPKE